MRGALNTSARVSIKITLLRWRFVGLIALFTLYFTQAIAASPYNAVTFDEQYHITPGYVYLKTGDLRFHHDQNPPLFEALLSWPLLLRADINLPTDHPAYALWSDVYLFSDDFIWHANADAQGIIHTGRVMAAIFGVLLAGLLFVWGNQLFGEAAGWMAAFLCVLDPNFIANAIPTLDLGLAVTSTLAAWRFWHYLKRPTRLNLVLAGFVLGVALGTKFLSVMLLPAFALLLLIYPASRPTLRVSRLTHYALRFTHFIFMLLLAWLVLWITYRFQFRLINGTHLPVPAPQYFESFIGMFLKSGEGRANYLMGQVSTTGWWDYFIVAFLIKTPLPTLIAIVVGSMITLRQRSHWPDAGVLLIPALFFFGGASISRLQLGYRYILPVLPFLFLMASHSVTQSRARNLSQPPQRFFAASRLRMTVGVVLAAWLIIGTLSIFPHYLSYFNEAIGGPAKGYNYLVDSNLDWGQDLPALRDWITQHPSNNLHLGFFGSAYPDRYGVNAISLPGYPLNAFGNEVDGFTSYSLEAGQYALSATLLRIGLVAKQFDLYRRFESLTPIDRAAYSILIYDVNYPADAPIERAVIVGPLASEVPSDQLGYDPDRPLRAKWCDAAQCFVFTPHPARYIVDEVIPFAPDLAQQIQAQAQPVSTPNTDRRYRVFDLDAAPILQQKLAHLTVAPVSIDSITTTFPITFDNGLALVGYEVKGVNVNTYWRVTDQVRPPVTIFVHALDAQDNIVGQNDSFGAATRMLEPGDVIAQQHPIGLKDGTLPGMYQLEVGLYNPITLDRFKAHPANAPTTDRVLLATIEVKP